MSEIEKCGDCVHCGEIIEGVCMMTSCNYDEHGHLTGFKRKSESDSEEVE